MLSPRCFGLLLTLATVSACGSGHGAQTAAIEAAATPISALYEAVRVGQAQVDFGALAKTSFASMLTVDGASLAATVPSSNARLAGIDLTAAGRNAAADRARLYHAAQTYVTLEDALQGAHLSPDELQVTSRAQILPGLNALRTALVGVSVTGLTEQGRPAAAPLELSEAPNPYHFAKSNGVEPAVETQTLAWATGTLTSGPGGPHIVAQPYCDPTKSQSNTIKCELDVQGEANRMRQGSPALHFGDCLRGAQIVGVTTIVDIGGHIQNTQMTRANLQAYLEGLCTAAYNVVN